MPTGFLLARRTCSISHSSFPFRSVYPALFRSSSSYSARESVTISVLFICVLVLFLQIWWLKITWKVVIFNAFDN